MIDAADNKQMHNSVTTGKENASKEWNYFIPMFLTGSNQNRRQKVFIGGFAVLRGGFSFVLGGLTL